MKINKPIVFFDLETTGLSTTSDRIVEIYMLKKNPDGTEDEFYSRFNPYPVPVGKEAEEMHGLSLEVLQNEPSFSERAKDILEFLSGSDIGGYNIINFDLPFLTEELIRSGINYSFRTHRIFDSWKIWTMSEQRNLKGAVKRFTGEDLEGAHQAKNDVIATAKIFESQLNVFGHLYDDMDQLSEITSELKDKLDLSGKFRITENKEIVLTFGKHKDKTVQQIYRDDAGYFQWIFEKSEMPNDVKRIAKSLYEKFKATA
jgi:DNA polymerase-3 subunit epsilon